MCAAFAGLFFFFPAESNICSNRPPVPTGQAAFLFLGSREAVTKPPTWFGISETDITWVGISEADAVLLRLPRCCQSTKIQLSAEWPTVIGERFRAAYRPANRIIPDDSEDVFAVLKF
jgi:hypothetical protein